MAEAGSGVKTSTDEAIEFLLLVLADGRVSVPDIEAEARAAGFLGEGNQIRQSKPFRSAKDALKIVSSRDGVGPGAVYYWSLPPIAAPTMRAPMRASSKDRAHMDKQGAHDEKKEGEGADGGGGTALHVRLKHHARPLFVRAHMRAHMATMRATAMPSATRPRTGDRSKTLPT